MIFGRAQEEIDGRFAAADIETEVVPGVTGFALAAAAATLRVCAHAPSVSRAP